MLPHNHNTAAASVLACFHLAILAVCRRVLGMDRAGEVSADKLDMARQCLASLPLNRGSFSAAVLLQCLRAAAAVKLRVSGELRLIVSRPAYIRSRSAFLTTTTSALMQSCCHRSDGLAGPATRTLSRSSATVRATAAHPVADLRRSCTCRSKSGPVCGRNLLKSCLASSPPPVQGIFLRVSRGTISLSWARTWTTATTAEVISAPSVRLLFRVANFARGQRGCETPARAR